MISLRVGLGFLALVSVTGCASEPPPSGGEPAKGIEEPSGVMRFGDELLIVGDHEPGTYYRLRLTDPAATRIRIEPDRLRRFTLAAGPYARDLESINVLADGRIVILSERLFSLLDGLGGQVFLTTTVRELIRIEHRREDRVLSGGAVETYER